jgi:regulatory associated protein of mTOR
LVGDSPDSSLKALACFVLCNIVDDYLPGQEACFNGDPNILIYCVEQLESENPLLRKWICFFIARLMQYFDEAIEQAIADDIHTKISELLIDSSPDVRCAAIYALSVFVVKSQTKSDERAKEEFKIGSYLYQSIADGSTMVRRELVIALSVFLQCYEEYVPPDLLKSIIFEDQEILKARSESVKDLRYLPELSNIKSI